MSKPVQEARVVVQRHWIYRHTLAIRGLHWVNVVCLTFLLMSGLQIFNATPALYWGAQSDFEHPLVSLQADPKDATKGVTQIFGRSFDTTGWLGMAAGPDGNMTERGFPAWITLPGAQSLAEGRRWHFFFAWLFAINGLAYLIYGFVSRHIARDLTPTADELRHIPTSIWEHIRLKFPHGDAARRYNVLQNLTYLLVIFILLPLIVLAGLAMSPAMDAAFPFLPTLFGGRQSARTVHFVLAWSLVAFVIVHVAMVIVSGFWNNLRSMITGRYDLEKTTETLPVEP